MALNYAVSFIVIGTTPGSLSTRNFAMPLPFTSPYSVIFLISYIWIFVPEFRFILRSLNRAESVSDDHGSSKIISTSLLLAAISGFSIAFFVQEASLPGAPVAWFFLGVSILFLSGVLRRHCFKLLDEFFSYAVEIKDDHEVIDSGAYRWVRHPSYSAALMVVAGTGITFGNWLSIIVPLAIAFPAYVYRSSVEERVLSEKIGEPYQTYMLTRKRLIPYVY